jgi:hypothetical protein
MELHLRDRLETTGTTPERIGVLAAELRIPIFEGTTEVADLEDVFLQLTAVPADRQDPARARRRFRSPLRPRCSSSASQP